MIKKILSLAAMIICMTACGNGAQTAAAQAENATTETNTQQMDTAENVKVKFETNKGDFTVMLYNETPLHRDNFVKLVNEQYYDSLLFHRVIKDFMAQAGDPNSKNATPDQMLGSGSPDYTIPAEIVYPKYFHKRGALAAARTGDQMNPERRSSGSQFYVVTGRKFTANQLENMQMQQIFNDLAKQHMDEIRQMQMAGDQAGLQQLQQQLMNEAVKLKEEGKGMTPEQIEAYATVGGAPHLDGQYTVFGEVIDGMDVIDAIEGAPTGRADRPVEDIRILSAKVVK